MNTKYIKGQFVRNIATVLVAITAGAFWACSNEESTLGGGVSEETRVMALENIGFTVTSAYVSLQAGNKVESALSSCYHKAGGAIVELDSITFEKTDKVHKASVDENCRFKVDGLNLESPYVLVEMYSDAMTCDDTISSVVDVSKPGEILVDNVTSFIGPRIRNLAADGVAFKEAKKQALQEAMNEFGIYDYPKNFEQLNPADRTNKRFVIDYVFGRILTEPDAFIHHDNFKLFPKIFAEYGQLNNVAKDSSTNTTWGDVFAENVMLYRYSLYSDVFNDCFPWNLSSDWETAESINAYFMNYLSIPFGFGTCNEASQGLLYKADSAFEAHGIDVSSEWNLYVFTNGDGDFNEYDRRNVMPYEYFVCETGAWKIQAKSDIEYTLGSMVDNRDGRTYKTTTFVLNGKTQTWMAENLNFDDSSLNPVDESWCFQDDCETYGRLYSWKEATLRDSVMQNEEMICKIDEDVYLDDEPMEICNYEKKIRLIQGICPDGWRLPSMDEWMALKEKFEVEGLENASWLELLGKQGVYTNDWNNRERLGADLIGFNVLPLGEHAVKYPAITEYFDEGEVFEIQEKAYKEGDEYVHKWYVHTSDGRTSDDEVSVRCIKND